MADAVALSDIENDQVEVNGNCKAKRRTLLVLAMIAVAVAAISVGVTCGLGYCSGGSTEPASRPTSQPTLEPSQPPTSAPTPDPVRAAQVVDFLNNITLSNQTLQYPAIGIPTPEEEALAWLIEEDPAKLNVSMGAARIRQRYALLTLWFRQPSLTQIKLFDWLSID